MDEDEKRIRGFQFLSQKPMLLVLNLGEEDAARLHEVEEQYRTGPLAGKANTAVTRGVRQDRSGTGGTSRRRSARVSVELRSEGERRCSASSKPPTGCWAP